MVKTLKDIANELGISVSTVSRVVNNKNRVKPETRKMVMEALKKTNYVPNQVARSLKKNSTKTIGVIIPDISELYFSQIIRGIDSIVCRDGYSIILADTGESKQREEHYLDIMFQQRVDALVLATVDMGGKKVMNFIDNDIPVVFIDNLPSINMPIDAVLIDNVMAGKTAVNHLLSLGHTRIASIHGFVTETTGAGRLKGYRQAIGEAGLPMDENLVRCGNLKEETGLTCMDELLDNYKEHPFTAVCTMSELITNGAIKSIRNHGLKIPEDIAFVGFDIHDRMGLIVPSITTVRQPEIQIGKYVGELLLKRFDEARKPPEEKSENMLTKQKIFLSSYMEIHESCGSKK